MAKQRMNGRKGTKVRRKPIQILLYRTSGPRMRVRPCEFAASRVFSLFKIQKPRLLEAGTTSSYGQSTPLNSSLVTGHSVNLSGLSANTTYHWRVKSKDSSGNLVASADKEVLVLDAGHVGLLTGSGAKQNLWPRVSSWLEQRSK